MDGILLLLLVISIISRVAKMNSKKKNANARLLLSQQAAARKTAMQNKPPRDFKAQNAPAQMNAAPHNPALEEPDWEETTEMERDGSIVMPPPEPHEHEGKPLPCPAEERERPRPARQAPVAVPAPAPRGGLQLSFTSQAVVQAVIMSEVLDRPRFEKGRRVIR